MKSPNGKRRIWLNTLAIVVALGIVLEGMLMLAVYVCGARQWPEGQADVAIVLGARVMPDGRLSTTLQHRTDRALSLYQAGRVRRIIVCGAMGDDEPVAEADAMAAELVRCGVEPEHIYRDAASADTVENVRNAMAIMDANGLKTAMLVTSEYHLTRALWIAQDQGLACLGAPAKGPDTLPMQIKANLRETLSWINYWTGGLLGRISGLSNQEAPPPGPPPGD